MMRLFMVFVLLMVGVTMSSCGENVQEGIRPKDGPTKKAPGPPGDEGFQASGEETTDPPPDEEDSDD